MSHPLRLFQRRANPSPPQWPSYTGTSKYVGVTPDGRVTIWVDPSLGAKGLTSAQALLTDAPRVVSLNDTLFGVTSGSTRVIVFALGGATDGTGGADHMSCNFVTGGDIEVCVAFGQPDRVSALFEAELSECAMNGNLCGESTGEALSRWCAMAVAPHALDDFATAPDWALSGMANWVDHTEETDQGAESIGCGMAFLSWMQARGAHGTSLATLAQAMVSLGTGSTLAQLYGRVTGDHAANAWPLFKHALAGVSVTSDDPFNAQAGTPAPVPTPVPTPTPPPTPPPVPPPVPPTSPCTLTPTERKQVLAVLAIVNRLLLGT